MSYYVDVHTHLSHSLFAKDWQKVIELAQASGLRAIVSNGLGKASNRAVLEMAAKFTIVKAAVGIYPVEAVQNILPDDFPLNYEKFSVDTEIDFIKDLAQQKKIHAVGECGLDGHWLDESTYAEQERVFIQLARIAKDNNLPLIVHSRKCESKVVEILAAEEVKKVNMHCWGGKTALAVESASRYGWSFSIPPVALRHSGFQKLVRLLPLESLLTETDAPYLAHERNTRNDPKNVLHTVKLIAQIKELSLEQTRAAIWDNYCKLFSC
jgi:TatD DNase family protein